MPPCRTRLGKKSTYCWKQQKANISMRLYLPAINTGLRRGEIYGLRWTDIDFNNKTINISQTLQRLKGKGLVFRKTTKTDGSRRSIAVTDATLDILKKIKARQARQKLKFGPLYQDRASRHLRRQKTHFQRAANCQKPLYSSHFSDAYLFFTFVINITHSTCPVCGNMSTGCTS